jgi:hypothetical protein
MLYISTPHEISNLLSLLSCFADDKIELSVHEMICKEDDSNQEAYQILNNGDRDDDNPIFDDDYLCIDLDSLECARRNRRKGMKCNNSSMDMAFFVEYNGNSYTVLVEFRLNFKITSNIKKDDLDKKVRCSASCSRHLLKFPIYPKQYFIFPHEKLSQFKHRFRRMNPQCSPSYIPIDVSELHKIFFSKP